jgi:hypothetical protein
MGARRILVANELTSYRQAIALAIRDLRPELEVFEAAPDVLDGEVARLCPDVVICSRVTRTVERRATNWVELYPDCKSYSTFSVGGERRALEEVQLSDLLSLCASLP